jgi:hypothetical protein
MVDGETLPLLTQATLLHPKKKKYRFRWRRDDASDSLPAQKKQCNNLGSKQMPTLTRCCTQWHMLDKRRVAFRKASPNQTSPLKHRISQRTILPIFEEDNAMKKQCSEPKTPQYSLIRNRAPS